MPSSRSVALDTKFRRELVDLDEVDAIVRESPLLGEKIQWIRDFLDDEWRRSITGRYQAALIIREVYHDVYDNNGAVYGARAVEAIEKAFNWKRSSIYQALSVADTFTPEDIEVMAALRLPTGDPLTFSHVVALAEAEDERQRRSLLNKVVDEGWSARKVGNAIRSARPDAPGKQETRGRPLARPKNFDAVLAQQAGFCEDFLKRDREVWAHSDHSLSGRACDLDLADVTPERIDRLEKHVLQMNLLAEKAKERAAEATYVRETFLRRLGQQGPRPVALLGGPPTAAQPTGDAGATAPEHESCDPASVQVVHDGGRIPSCPDWNVSGGVAGLILVE